jgi:hypothetical protein
MTVKAEPSAAVALEPSEPSAVALALGPSAGMTISQMSPAALETVMPAAAQITLGEVCAVNSGTIVVLAASDGPLRTRNGGYFLLNPATNPPQG